MATGNGQLLSSQLPVPRRTGLPPATGNWEPRRELLPPSGARLGPGLGPGALGLGRGGRSARALALGRAQLEDLVAQCGSAFEFQLLGGIEHLGFEGSEVFLGRISDLVATCGL